MPRVGFAQAATLGCREQRQPYGQRASFGLARDGIAEAPSSASCLFRAWMRLVDSVPHRHETCFE